MGELIPPESYEPHWFPVQVLIPPYTRDPLWSTIGLVMGAATIAEILIWIQDNSTFSAGPQPIHHAALLEFGELPLIIPIIKILFIIITTLSYCLAILASCGSPGT